MNYWALNVFKNTHAHFTPHQLQEKSEWTVYQLFTQGISFVSLPFLNSATDMAEHSVLYLPRQSVSFSPGNSAITLATLSLVFLPAVEMRDLNSTQKL